jgi:hypothetical protein
MITANLTGNFGNHMWNYSLCRVIADKLGYDWGIHNIPTHDYFSGMVQMYFMEIDYGKPVTKIGINQRGLNMYDGITNEYYDIPKHLPYHNKCCINMYDPNVFNINDNTMIHLISQSEDYLIDRKSEILEWFQIKEEYINKYNSKLEELGISLDENTCVINFRGGEYKVVTNLIARKEYWSESINKMLSINTNMKFLIITDDMECAKNFIGDYPCYHIDIGFDFYTIYKAQYIILSNSSFGWWPAWLSKSSKLTIAPEYWSQHNTSDGYWGLGDQYTRCFKYMSRSGELHDYDTCKNNALQYYKNNNLI